MSSNVNNAHRERGRFAAFFVSVARECDGSFTADRTGCFHERWQPRLHQTSKRGRPPASRQKTAHRSPRPRKASVLPAGQSNCVGRAYALVGEARRSLAAVRPQAEPGSEGNVSQERQLEELRGRLDRAQVEQDLSVGNPQKLKELTEENLQLKLRLGLLVRLLISKGLITAQEYAALIAEVRPKS